MNGKIKRTETKKRILEIVIRFSLMVSCTLTKCTIAITRANNNNRYVTKCINEKDREKYGMNATLTFVYLYVRRK